jgi:hypothetical protein
VPEPNGEMTAPDFHLRCGGRTYAVEVKALMTQYEQEKGGPISELGIWERTRKQVEDEVEREAITRDLLRGEYILTLAGPYDNFYRSTTELKKLLMDFITETHDIDEFPMPSAPTVSPCGQRYFLQKTGLQKNQVRIAMFGDGADWGWSVVEELSLLAFEAVTSKAQKLRKEPHPWVLLLLDWNHVGTAREYAKVRERFGGAEGETGALGRFHSVYIIDCQGQVFHLYPSAGVAWVG